MHQCGDEAFQMDLGVQPESECKGGRSFHHHQWGKAWSH